MQYTILVKLLQLQLRHGKFIPLISSILFIPLISSILIPLISSILFIIFDNFCNDDRKKATWISGNKTGQKGYSYQRKKKDITGIVLEVIPGLIEVDWVSGSMICHII
jgi:hypothetical protein